MDGGPAISIATSYRPTDRPFTRCIKPPPPPLPPTHRWKTIGPRRRGVRGCNALVNFNRQQRGSYKLFNSQVRIRPTEDSPSSIHSCDIDDTQNAELCFGVVVVAWCIIIHPQITQGYDATQKCNSSAKINFGVSSASVMMVETI